MPSYSRRDFLKIGTAVAAASLFPLPLFASTPRSTDHRRMLSFYNTHTAETLHVCYYEQGCYRPGALARIDHILRDHRSDDIIHIDPNLLDLLFAIHNRIGRNEPFHVISGYRSPATNEMLRRISRGVAKRSYHTKGKAIDIRLPGFSTQRLRDVCLSMKAGGVGFYPRSNFVHVDTGQVRTW